MLIKITNRQMKIHKESMMDYTLEEVKKVLTGKKIEYVEDSRHLIFDQPAATKYNILYELSKYFDIELM